MSRMLDLIRASALPSHMMQIASRGALSVPPHEMIEILVYLANHNKIFSRQASLTLAGWEESSSKAVAADANAPKEVLDYLINPKNLRPVLFPILLENPSVSQAAITELAASASQELLEVMLKSERVNQSHIILDALKSNPHAGDLFSKNDTEQSKAISPEGAPPLPVESEPPAVESKSSDTSQETTVTTVIGEMSDDKTLDEDVEHYLKENASEIAAAGDKPFQPLGGILEGFGSGPTEEAHPEAAIDPSPVTDSSDPVAKDSRKAVVVHKKTYLAHEDERGSALQKISKLDVKGRIQLAFKGNKEERSILVRDGTKLVALAVLDSPKITDGEVERFAGQKNVLEAVLRGISIRRRFIKNYVVVRNLVSNPRTPIDLGLGLMKNLLVADLKNLSGNREVSETVSKLALRMYQQKKNPSKNSMQ